MSLVEFFSPDFDQDSDTQVVYKGSELIDISDGAVSMKLVGKAHPVVPSPFSTKPIRRAPIPAWTCCRTRAKRPAYWSRGAWS